jgi:CubicO group peptidase (beta-lactamase class C family)
VRAGSTQRIGADTIFQAASLSKPPFAQAVLQLAQHSVIDLDAPLRQYFSAPYQRLEAPWRAESAVESVSEAVLDGVTARMALQHSTGFPNWARSQPLSSAFTPGSRWSYSGEGYVLLQRALEQRTGEPLEAMMQRLVLQPLGMRSSSYARPPSNRIADGHDREGRPLQAENWPQPLASSSLLTTLPDYARFMRALVSQTSEAPLAALLDRPVPVDPALHLEWGLGWAVERLDDRVLFFHWGANPGFHAFAIGEAGRGEAIVILANGEGGLDLAQDVVELLWHERHPLFSFRMLHPN